MSANKYLVFILAAVAWTAYFYVIDWLIMEGQGLPVGWSLMPA